MSERKHPRPKKKRCLRCGYKKIIVRHGKCADCRFQLRAEIFSIQNAKRAKKRAKCTPEKSSKA